MPLMTTRRSALRLAGMLTGLCATGGMAASRGQSDALKLREFLSLPDSKIDYGVVKLAIDKMVDPSADIDRAERQIGVLFREAAALCGYSFARQVSVEARVDALRTCLYRRGPWNENRPFRYDLENDPTGKEILENNLLPTYLEKRLGNCVAMPMLFLVLAQRMGVEACLSTAPEHVFVKVRDESGVYTNHECTHDGGLKADASYVREFEITPEAVKLGSYLRPLSKQEGILVMAEVLGSHYFRKEDGASLRAFADLVFEMNPGSLQAIHWTTAVYGLTLNVKFKKRYQRYEDVPPGERDEARRLLRNIRDLEAKAHALGWRPVSAAFEQNYRQLVQGARTTKEQPR